MNGPRSEDSQARSREEDFVMTFRSSGPMLGLVGLVLAGCGGGGNEVAKTSGGGVLKGSVAYRERMALPPDATVEVKLIEVSVQDVAAPVIATTILEPAGRQVPLPFELHYDPSKIDANKMYSVRATIRSASQLLFTTDTVLPVITRGNPTQADLMLVRVKDGGGTSAGGGSSLVGTAWRLQDLGGTPALAEPGATLEFPEPGQCAGSGSCNRFFGPVQVSAESMSFGELGLTRMACPDPVGAQETKYLAALRGAQRFTVDGSTLQIYSAGTDKPLRFVRTKP
jgi:putative lipoprotein